MSLSRHLRGFFTALMYSYRVMNYVVGSGPAGVACAVALLEQGKPVTMIDTGFTLEQANQQKLDALAATPPAEWHGDRIAFLRGDMDAGVDGIPLKLAYGSGYPYTKPAGAANVTCEGANTKPGYSLGGFSNVWGASLMPYRQQDMAGWPIAQADLEPHYRALFRFMPVAAEHDGLDAAFPTYAPYHSPMPLSPQAQTLLRSLTARQDAVARQHVLFGRSRLAVNAAQTPIGYDKPAGPCVACGLCMYGCPYRLIYTTADTVGQLMRNSNFTYLPGYLVRSVEESADGVTIHALDAQAAPRTLNGDRVFLAGGVLSTTEILLRSLKRFDQPVTLHDSQYFLLPMLRLGGVPGFRRDELHTLAQLFLEIVDPEVSPYAVHLQTYTYNDLFEAPIRKMLGPLAALFPWKSFLSRLYLFQGYIHSSQSAEMTATLSGDTLAVRSSKNPETEVVLQRVIRKLLRLRRATGSLPLIPLMRRGEPGRGFHTGGSFPMQAQPDTNSSDIYGRPAGMRRVHAVDSTVLPSVPATTITFTVMANAHRIGSAIAQYEGQE